MSELDFSGILSWWSSLKEDTGGRAELRRAHNPTEVVFLPAYHRLYARLEASNLNKGDVANRCLSSATACLYGITEAAVLAAGYAPAIGFIHSGKPLSFVYDIADLFKFETVVPLAFQIAKKNPANPEQMVRLACRDVFRSSHLLERIIPTIEDILSAGGLTVLAAPADALPPAIEEKEGLADDGHRS